jgi:hypothetical protein
MAEVRIFFAEKKVEDRNGEIIDWPILVEWLDDPEGYGVEHLREVFGCRLETEKADKSAEAIAELAYAVCNSYPEEMHCAAHHYDIVERYREEGNRSLSVGDVVEVDGAKLMVASFGFKDVPDDVELSIIEGKGVRL